MVFIGLAESLREPLLIAEVLLIVLMIQMAIIYIKKIIRDRQISQNNMLIAWSIFLISYSAVFVLYIIADFYVEGTSNRVDVLNMSYIAAVFGAAVFAYYTEREIKIKRHIFSIIMFIIVGLIVVNALIKFIESSVYLTFVVWLLFLVLVIFYTKYFTTKRGEKWRLNVYSLIIGTILAVLGFGGNSDWMVNALGGFWIRLFGDCLILIGTMLVSVLFIGVPSLAEFEWSKNLRYLNVMYKNGVSMAHYYFNIEKQKTEKELDGLMMAGGLTSITQIISDLIKSKKRLDFVDHGDLKLIFYYGEYVTNVLIVEQNLAILRTKLKKFTEQFEFIYEENLSRWDGDLDQFKFIDALVKANFEE